MPRLAAMLALLVMTVSPSLAETKGRAWKSPTCGCCKAWVEYMKTKGYSLDVTEMDKENINRMKASAGIGAKFAGCHSAEIGGYLLEGHVPAEDIDRLLKEKPDALGLSVPGMPVGSPGMETDGTVEPYQVLLMKKDGTSEVFASYPGNKAAK